MSFDADIELRPIAAGSWEGTIDRSWWTPRGPLGGYVMAFALRAMENAVADPERQARSVTMHFLRPPAPGAVTIGAIAERAGRSLTTVSSRMEQEGALVGIALGAYSKPWPGPRLEEEPMPEVKPPEPDVPLDDGRSNRPPFIERLTMQRRFGDPPFSGSESSEVGGWLGLREERPLDAAAIAVLADAWFPAPWPRLKELAPAPTVELTIYFRAPLPLQASVLLGRFRSACVREGFFDEQGELWAPDGTLVAQSRQFGLLIGAQA